MDIRTDCPYCSNNLDLTQSQLPTGPIAVKCPFCGKIFEYIHGFGSYTLPRAGKGVKVHTKSEDSRGDSNVEVYYPKRPQIVAWTLIILMMFSGMSSAVIMFMPSGNFEIFILVILIAVIGFLIVVLFLYRAFKTIDEG